VCWPLADAEGILFLQQKNAVGVVGGLFPTIYYIIITLIWTRVYMYIIICVRSDIIIIIIVHRKSSVGATGHGGGGTQSTHIAHGFDNTAERKTSLRHLLLLLFILSAVGWVIHMEKNNDNRVNSEAPSSTPSHRSTALNSSVSMMCVFCTFTLFVHLFI